MVDDVERSADEVKEETLVPLGVDVLSANPIVVKGDGSPRILNTAVSLRQVQFPQQYDVPPQGVSPTAAGSV